MYLMSGPWETVSFVSDVCPGPDVSLGKQNQLVSCGTFFFCFAKFFIELKTSFTMLLKNKH